MHKLLSVLFISFTLVGLLFAQDYGSRSSVSGGVTNPINYTAPETAIFIDDMNGDNTVTGLQARGWVVLNEDGGGTTDPFFQGNSTVFPAYEGPVDGYVASNYNGANASGVIDQWLISPEITVTAGDTLSFWTRSPTGSIWDDSLFVRYSTTAGIVPGAFDQTWGRYKTNVNNWEMWSFNFNHSGTIRFAIQYYIFDGGPAGTYSDYLGIDLVQVNSAGGALVEKLLLTEFVVTPTGAEFIEIFNPNASPVDLTDYYLSDVAFAGGPEYYYHVVQGLYGGAFGDFNSKFPDGATIGAGEHQIIALNGDADFFSAYGVNPTYEIDQPEFQSGVPDAIPDMMETHPGSIYGPDSTHNPGLTNGDEMIMLYYWDGMSDLVGDVDYVLYNSASPTPNDEAVDKTGVTIDGPDPGTTGSTYLDDTPAANQLSALSPTSGFSAQRSDYTEGAQVMTGGNGVTGSDETSEDMNNTWVVDIPTPFLAIPVELTSFTANVIDQTVVLNWSTATETNNHGFEIEKRTSNDFRAIGFVNGAGTTTQPQDYTFVDANAEVGINYYRLKQVDLDGTYSYSDEIEVEFGAPSFYSLEQNYPNPFNPSTKIIFNLAADSKVTLRVFDVLGQKVTDLLSSQLDAGRHEIKFDASLFNSGVYFYRIDAEGIDGSSFTQVRKMMLTK